MRSFLASATLLVFCGLLCSSANAQTVLGNLPAVNDDDWSTLTGNSQRAKAIGGTVGAQDLDFVGFDARLASGPVSSNTITGGIYSSVSNAPGTLLQAFNSITLNADTAPTTFSFTATSPFVLSAGQTYWFVLAGDQGSTTDWVDWLVSTSSSAPTATANMTFVGGSRTSTNGGAWTTSATVNSFAVRANVSASPSVAPEPGSLALLGLALPVAVGIVRRRKA